MNALIKYFMVMLFLFNAPASAGVFELTPPASLSINSQNVTAGIFTLETFTGYNASLEETVILNSESADDVSRDMNIGSGTATSFLNYPGAFPLVQFGYNFDPTAPDLTAISANVLSAATDITVALPFSSATTDFFEVIDFNGVSSFYTTEATLDFSASGAINIDLFGDASIFAIFAKQDVILPSNRFQPHGNVSTVPLPASFWLLGSGLIGLIGMRKRHQKTSPST